MIEGLWPEIVGSKCTLRAIPVGYTFRRLEDENTWPETFTTDQVFKIEAVYHRVTQDGKIYPSYKLEGISGRLFRPDELIIEEVCCNNTEP